MNQNLQLPFDICANRSRHNPESAAANRKVHGSKEAQRERVYRIVAARGYDGATCDEVAAAMGVAPNQISGRISELKIMGRLLKTNRRRFTRNLNTAAVLVSAREVCVNG